MWNKTYTREQLVEYFQAVDAHLNQPIALFIIGGSAAVLQGVWEQGTQDVDVLNATDMDAFRSAEALARKTTSIFVPVTPCTIADLPYNYEDRLTRLDLPLKNLQLFCADVHDVALAKLVAFRDKDVEFIETLHSRGVLKKTVLVERYHAEMTHAITDMDRLKTSFEILIEQLPDEG